MFFRYDLPWDLLNNIFVNYTILPVILWEVYDRNVNTKLEDHCFGTPFLLCLPQGKIPFKKLYDETCERLFRNCDYFMNANSRISYDCYSENGELFGNYNLICFVIFIYIINCDGSILVLNSTCSWQKNRN